MRKLINTGCFIFVVLFMLSCNKRLVPASKRSNQEIVYDSAAFDYVFTEALKQKFMGNAGDALKYLEQCININPKSDAAYYEMAQIALMISDQKRGKKYILKALDLNERNIWYLTMAANIYYQENKIDSAIILYEKAVSYFPDKDYIKMNLATIYSQNKEYKKAAEVYNYFENKYGASETTSISILRNLINSHEFKKAEEKARELIKASPDDIVYYGLLAEIYRSSGEKEKAKEIYNDLLNDSPGDPQILLTLADFLLTEKQFEDFFPVLNKVALNDSISREDKISLFSKVIGDSSIVKNYREKIETTLIVLEAENNDDGIIVLLRPELYIIERDYYSGRLRLEAIIKEQTENYFAWEKLLVLYSEMKDWDKLMEKGEECATKFNRAYVPKILYASAALEKNKLNIAEEELRKAKILAGSDTDKMMQVLVMSADVYYRKKEYIKSFDTFKEALKLDPDDVIILNNYAYYLAEQNQELVEAERMAKIVIEKEKGNPTYLDTYAWILYKRGRYREAEKIMEDIIKSSQSTDAEYFEHLGYINKALKQCEKAVVNWKTAYELDKTKNNLLKEIENCTGH